MNLESKSIMSLDEVKAVEHLLKTLDRFGLMPPYLITIEKWPKAYHYGGGDVEYEEPQRAYGAMIIRIIGKSIFRIEVLDDEL